MSILTDEDQTFDSQTFKGTGDVERVSSKSEKDDWDIAYLDKNENIENKDKKNSLKYRAKKCHYIMSRSLS